MQYHRRSFWFAGLFLVVMMIGGGVWAVGHTFRALNQLKQGEVEAAARTSGRALPIVKVVSSLTLHQIPDLELWRLGLQTIYQAPNTKSLLTQNLISGQSTSSAVTFKTVTSQLITLGRLFEKSWLVKRVISTEDIEIAQLIADLELIRSHLFTDDHTWLIIFQNSQELRATGGFAGSYGVLTFQNGNLAPFEIHDIYQPDGQFTGFVQAPPGVAEYLSSGKGLRLPDANWWPDFPMSARQMLVFFALGKTQTIEGVISVNLDVVRDILQITGPVYLPDYQQEVTSENVASVLRSNRDAFFPGSQAKQHLLASFFTSLKLKIEQLSTTDQLRLLKLVHANLPSKQLQVYSANPALQARITELGLAGLQQTQLADQTQPPHLYLHPVESNVGINKANQGIQRAWSLELGETASTFQVQFSNQTNPALPYVNYQRLYLLPSTQVASITYQGNPLTSWDDQLITTSNGEELRQIGFLTGLLPAQTSLLTVVLHHSPLPDSPVITIQKQGGTNPTPLTVTYQGETMSTEITQDFWFNL